MRVRALTVVGTISVVGALAFLWPLLVTPDSSLAHGEDAPWLFALMLPLLLGVVLSELSDGVLDAKRVAMLGVLAALGAVLRPLGAGTGGIELVFLPIILGVVDGRRGAVAAVPDACCLLGWDGSGPSAAASLRAD